MKELFNRLRQLQKDGYEQVSIIQVLNWIHEIKRDRIVKRIERKK